MKHKSENKKNRFTFMTKAYWLGEWFNPHVSFLRLPSFWVPFLIILAVFVIICVKVSSDENLVFSRNWTVQCMYEWFKIPFWVLALLIPVVGLFNANHKSEQAKAAMELTKSQNNFANYYKHMEEFSKYIDSIVGQADAPTTFANYRPLHSHIFPLAHKSDYSVSKLTEQYIDEFLDNFIAITKELSGRSAGEVLEHLSALEGQRNLLCSRFDFSFGCYPQADKDRSKHLIDHNFSVGSIHVINGRVKDYLEYISRFPYLLHRICMFDRDYLDRSEDIAKKFNLIGAIVCFTLKGSVGHGGVIDFPLIDWDRVNANL